MRIGITIGDPAGIGPELVLRGAPQLGDVGECSIFGNKRLLKMCARDLVLMKNYEAIESCIIDVTGDVVVDYGRSTRKTARVALHSIRAALESHAGVIVTAPIVKATMRKLIPGFIGHTEYFAEFFGVREYAMTGLWRDKRIMLLTTHLPLRKVFRIIDAGFISERIAFFKRGLERYFKIKNPSIGVSAVNPHAHEFSLGEDEEIQRGVLSAKKKGIEVEGPFPADTLFTRRYDGFIAVYHDQAMVFLKSKRTGLNFTLGLPIIRLSPLCGAALDIAGKRSADISGFVNALRTGVRLYNNMRKYDKNH